MKNNYSKTFLALVLGLLFNAVAGAQIVANSDYGETPFQFNPIMVIPNVLLNDTLNGMPVTSETVTIQIMASDNPYISVESDGTAWITPTAMFTAGIYTAFYKIYEVQNPLNYDIGAVTINVGGCLTPEITISDIVPITCTTAASLTVNNLPTGIWTLRTWRNGIAQPLIQGAGSSYTVTGLYGGVYHFTVSDATYCQSVTVKTALWNNCILDLDYVGTYADYNANGHVDAGDLINYSFTVSNNMNEDLLGVAVGPVSNSVIIFNGDPIPLAVGESDSSTFTGYQVITQNDINNGYVSDQIGAIATLPPFQLISTGTFAHVNLNISDGIKLTAYVDNNGNGTRDMGEPNFTHGNFSYEINNDGILNNVSTSSGTHFLYETNPTTSYDISYVFDSNYPYYSTGVPSYNNITVAAGSGITTYQFPITIIPHDNLMISINPYGILPRPGMFYHNLITYKNLGTTTMSGTITFNKDALVTITNVSQSGTVATPNGFTYDFVNLQPNEIQHIDVRMQVPPVPQVTTGASLINSASITLPQNDVSPTDNSSTLSQVIVNSYDPNDKTENHGPTIEHAQFSASDYLTYTIQFENMGTASAINIEVEDLLDGNLDETTVRMVDASHPYVLNRVGSALKWTFAAIDLPPSVEDTNIGKGYIVFQVKPKTGYAIGDVIPNSADIYFDFNPAIVTNVCTTEFVETLSINKFDQSDFDVYPNPANKLINISNQKLIIDEIHLTDISGKTIILNKVNAMNITLDLSQITAGIYFAKIKSSGNEKTIKIVKR